MNLLAISASNTIDKGKESASTKVCYLIGDILKANGVDPHSFKVLPLIDHDLRPCRLCGSCASQAKCIHDSAFDSIYAEIVEADAIFLVVPHYSTIPAKLTIIFEKLNELFYAGWIRDQEFISPCQNLPVAIIGHGGMPESDKSLKYYHDFLIAPVARTLRSLSFRVVRAEDTYPEGIPFGLPGADCIRMVPGRIFPEIIHDWDQVRARIEPLVLKTLVTTQK